MADGINLFFNLAALLWSSLMIIFPRSFSAPEMMFSILPIVFFVFKLSKMFFLYHGRLGTNIRQSIASGIAGLALSHTIGRAMLAGMINNNIGFFRTPKMAGNNRVLRALLDCREELLFAIALVLCVVIIPVTLSEGVIITSASEIDVLMWRVVIGVQSIPFIAAVLVSLISALPSLPANIIGPMSPINRETDESPITHD
jgi:hypothetical protein